MSTQPFDDDAVIACADLVGRAGAAEFQIGYLHDDVPTDQAGWYAHAQYKGARIIADNHRSPDEAAEALARRLLTGARCSCGRLVALSDTGAFAHAEARMADGSIWRAEDAAAAGQCQWTRLGPRWQKGCADQAQQPERPVTVTRRQPKRRSRRARKR